MFINPLKVAGTSFEIALSRFVKERDIVTPIEHPDDRKLGISLGVTREQNYKKIYAVKYY